MFGCIGFVKKADFNLSVEVDAAEWVPAPEILPPLQTMTTILPVVQDFPMTAWYRVSRICRNARKMVIPHPLNVFPAVCATGHRGISVHSTDNLELYIGG